MRITTYILLVALTIFSLDIYGATPIEHKIATCSAIKGDLARLQCFDNLSESLKLNKSQPIKQNNNKTGKWVLKQEKNPIDDSITAVAILMSDSGTSKMGRPIGLVLRCSQGETEAYITWGYYLGDEADVLSRIGSMQASTSAWNLSSDKEASFYPGNASEFIKQLLTVDSFVAQVTPYDESPVTAVFDLHGIKEAVQPLRDTCKW